MGNKQLTFTLVAIAAGFILAIPATSHVGDLMWGHSAYSESNLMWSMDNSGQSRFINYAGPMFQLGSGFAFMLSMIPTAGAWASVGRRKTAGFNCAIPATVCTVLFTAGYLWWRNAYVAALGFPQEYLQSEQIHEAYGALPGALALVAFGTGIATLLSGALARILLRNQALVRTNPSEMLTPEP